MSTDLELFLSRSEPEDPIDRDYLKRNYLAIGCEDVFLDVLALYLKSSPQKLEMINQLMASNSSVEIQPLAHSMKGEAGSVGARLVMQHAASMEQAARRSDMDELRQLLPKLENELANYTTLLSEWLNG